MSSSTASAAESGGNGAAPKYLTGTSLWSATILLAMANFLAVLDISIANVSVPNIAGGFAASTSEGTWVITSYSVAEAIVVPLTGWLVSRFGTVRLIVWAMSAFGMGSALCALAPSFGFLVGSRVLQGVAGAPLIPLSQTLMMQIFPKGRQSTAMSIWSMTSVSAPILGPVIGGSLCDAAGWPTIFWINVPIALISAPLLWRTIRSFETPVQHNRIDVVGLVLLIIWVGALQLMLDFGKDHDWFASTLIVVLALTAAIGFVAFVIWELTDSNPVVRLQLLRQKSLSASLVALALAMGAYFSSVVLTPLWLQTDMGYTATLAGYAVAGSGFSAIVASAVTGRLMSVIDPRWLSFTALLYLALICFIRSGATSEMSFGQISLQVSFMGFGMSLFIIPLMTSALGSVAPREIAAASGLMNFVRCIACAFGTSIVNTAWENDSAGYHAELAGTLTNTTGMISTLVHGGLSENQALAYLEHAVNSQAVMLSTNHIFISCVVAFLIAACAVWLLPPPKPVIKAAAY